MAYSNNNRNNGGYTKGGYEKRESGRSGYGEKRSYGEKQYPEKKNYGEKRAYGEKKFYGEKNFGQRSYGEKKPYGDSRPYEGRRFQENKESRPAKEAPYGAREQEQDELPFMLFGRNAVREAIKSGRSIDKILVTKEQDGSLREILEGARERKLVIREVDRRKLDEVCMPFGHGGKTANHQGICAFTPGVSIVG